jgi:hypothetical protein
MTNFTHYSPIDILNFIKESLKNDTNLMSVTMAPPNDPLKMEADAKLAVQKAIIIEFKEVIKSDSLNNVHDSLKAYMKDNAPSFNLIPGSGNTLLVLLL